jgi:hypothetical protein
MGESMNFVILGSSPNALFAALRLREAGHPVTLVETRPHLGTPCAPGGLSTLHLAPELLARFRISLDVQRYTGRTALLADGRHLRVTPHHLEGSDRDAARWPKFCELLDQAAGLLQALWNRAEDRDLHAQWRALGRRASMEVLRLPWTSLRDLLDEWFHDEALKGMLAEAALEGVLQGPFAPGTSFHLLRRWALGEFLTPATGSLQPLLQAVQASGTDILHRPGDPPRFEWPATLHIGGRALPFDALLSDLDAKYTFTKLVSPRFLETEFNAHLHKLRSRGSLVRVSAKAASLGTDLYHVDPGLRKLEKAFDPTKYGSNSPAPPLIFGWTSPDSMQASMSYLPHPNPPAPSFPVPVTDLHIHGPAHYESEWLYTGGHLFGGETDLSQSFFLRPIPAYESPCDNIELSGSASDYSGRAGVQAAEKLLYRSVLTS